MVCTWICTLSIQSFLEACNTVLINMQCFCLCELFARCWKEIMICELCDILEGNNDLWTICDILEGNNDTTYWYQIFVLRVTTATCWNEPTTKMGFFFSISSSSKERERERIFMFAPHSINISHKWPLGNFRITCGSVNLFEQLIQALLGSVHTCYIY